MDNYQIRQNILSPLDECLSGRIAERDISWWSWKSAVREERKNDFMAVRRALLPYYHRFMMADKDFFRNGHKDTQLKIALLETIEREGNYAGRLFHDVDIVKAAENWANSLMVDNHEPWIFFMMMQAILKRDYKPDWDAIYDDLKNKLARAKSFGNFKIHEMYCLLMGITMIERTNLPRGKKDELVGLLRYHWQFIKYMYSVLIHYIVGLKVENFASVAYLACKTTSHPYMHWFYKAFNENFDELCPEGMIDEHSHKPVREQALVHIKKMEEIIKHAIPSKELDELFDILFPKVIKDVMKQSRPKTYEELESAVDDLSNRYNMVLGQLTNAVNDVETDKISADDLTAAFLRFPTDLALGLFGSVSTLLAQNATWQKYAGTIQKQILSKQEEKKMVQVAGDYVVNKNVAHEVAHVAAGATGIAMS